MDIAIKFQILSSGTVYQWILKYNNGHDELKAYNSGENSIMTNGRKTTYEERIEIVKDCIKTSPTTNCSWRLKLFIIYPVYLTGSTSQYRNHLLKTAA